MLFDILILFIIALPFLVFYSLVKACYKADTYLYERRLKK